MNLSPAPRSMPAFMTAALRRLRSVRLLLACACALPVLPLRAADAAPAPAVEKRDPAAEFAAALASVQDDGRRTIDEMLNAYSRLSVMQHPGASALRIDLLRMTEQIHRERRRHFSVEEVDGLTLRNPNFWQAWFEFHPQDSSLLMLHAGLLLDAGALHRASTLFTIGVQALPLASRERMLWLTQQARANWALYKRLADLEARDQAGRRDQAAARQTRLEAALRDWPDDAFALEELVKLKAGVKPPRDSGRGRADPPVVLSKPARERVAAELGRLRYLAPTAAARYGGDAALAGKFLRLWADFLDEERPADDRQNVQLAEVCGKLAEPELRAWILRVSAARRGFYAPADLTALAEVCAERLTPSEFKDLSEVLEAGNSPGTRLSVVSEVTEELLPGMDPQVHPVYAEHAVRELVRETFWIEAVGDDADLRAMHQWQRSVRLTNVGCYTAALADLDAALAHDPKRAEWLVDRAMLLAKLGRPDEAEPVFAQALKLEPKNEHLRSTLAIFRFGQGRFAEAERLYRGAKSDDPNRAYTVIMAYLASARRGAADQAWLKKNLGSAGGRWPAAILRHLAGEIDRQALLDAAGDDSDLRNSEQQCEAFFTLGELALARGDAATAKLELENCEHAGIVGFIEYGLAQLELLRLEPERAKRTAPPATDAAPANPETPPKGERI